MQLHAADPEQLQSKEVSSVVEIFTARELPANERDGRRSSACENAASRLGSPPMSRRRRSSRRSGRRGDVEWRVVEAAGGEAEAAG